LLVSLLSLLRILFFFIAITKSIREKLGKSDGDKGLIRYMFLNATILEIWCLLPLRERKLVCKWVYAIKVGPNGEVDILKLSWWQKDILKSMVLITYFSNILSPVAEITTIHLIIVIAAINH